MEGLRGEAARAPAGPLSTELVGQAADAARKRRGSNAPAKRLYSALWPSSARGLVRICSTFGMRNGPGMRYKVTTRRCGGADRATRWMPLGTPDPRKTATLAIQLKDTGKPHET